MQKYCFGILLIFLSYSINKCMEMENDNPLITAVKNNNVLEFRGALFTLDISQDALSDALLFASAFGDAEHVRLLIGAGALINCKDPGGNTPVHLAVLYENSKTLQALIDGDGEALRSTGCCIAQLCNSLRSALQIKQMPSFTIQNNWGKTAIEIAVLNGSNLIQLFPAHEVRDARNSSRQTTLHIAAKHNHAHIVQYLIGKGINLIARDNKGKTAIQLTEEEAIKLLLRRAMSRKIERLQQGFLTEPVKD